MPTTPKMNTSRYKVVLYAHAFFIVVDLLLNILIDTLRPSNVVQLLVFVFQDTCILFGIIIIFLMFFSTYVFQAGLVWLLISRFKVVIMLLPLYLALSISYHVWKLTLCWDNVYRYIWTSGLIALYVIQRSVAVLYYYFYHQVILCIADPRFYTRSDWIVEELSKRN